MKLTRRQLRKLIIESYQELHRLQSKAYERGEVAGLPGSIAVSGNKNYYEALRSFLYHDGVDAKPVTGAKFFNYTLGNGHSLNIPHYRTWPNGFSVVRLSLFAAYQKANDTYPGIKFAVSGNPEVDAKFIIRCCALSDDDFLRLCRKTFNGPRVGSWESEILPGYPHAFIGL